MHSYNFPVQDWAYLIFFSKFVRVSLYRETPSHNFAQKSLKPCENRTRHSGKWNCVQMLHQSWNANKHGNLLINIGTPQTVPYLQWKWRYLERGLSYDNSISEALDMFRISFNEGCEPKFRNIRTNSSWAKMKWNCEFFEILYKGKARKTLLG